jgi:hypothetical protein
MQVAMKARIPQNIQVRGIMWTSFHIFTISLPHVSGGPEL